MGCQKRKNRNGKDMKVFKKLQFCNEARYASLLGSLSGRPSARKARLGAYGAPKRRHQWAWPSPEGPPPPRAAGYIRRAGERFDTSPDPDSCDSGSQTTRQRVHSLYRRMYPDTGSISPIPLKPGSGRTRCDAGSTRSLVPLLLVYTFRVDLSSPLVRCSAASCLHAFCVASSLYIPRRFKLTAYPPLDGISLLARLLRGFLVVHSA